MCLYLSVFVCICQFFQNTFPQQFDLDATKSEFGEFGEFFSATYKFSQYAKKIFTVKKNSPNSPNSPELAP